MQSYDEESLQNAILILKRVVTDKSVKLRFGATKRAEIKSQLAKQQPVSSYRAHFIIDSMRAVKDTLVTEALAFEKEHPYDKVSVTDFIDILISLANEFEKASQEN